MRGILNSQDGDMDCYLYNKGKDDPLKADLTYIYNYEIRQAMLSAMKKL